MKIIPMGFSTLSDRARSRVAISGFFFISGFGFSTWASRIPTFKELLHLNEIQLGGVLFALPLGLILTMPVTGYLVSRFSSHRIMLIGCIAFNCMMAILGFCSEIWQLTLVLFGFGMSRNLFSISANAQSVGVQALFTKSIISSFHAVWSIAGFMGAAIGSLMIAVRIPPVMHFLGVSVALSVLAWFLAPYSIPETATRKAQPVRFALPDQSLLKYGLIAFVSMACEGTMYDWSGVYFQQVIHAPQAFIAAGFVGFTIAMTAGRLAGDWLANRFGRKTLLMYSSVLLAGGVLLTAAFPYLIVAIAGCTMAGFGVASIMPLVIGFAGSQTQRAGTAITAISSISYLGFLLIPPLVGFLAEALNLRYSFLAVGLLGIGMVILASSIRIDR